MAIKFAMTISVDVVVTAGCGGTSPGGSRGKKNKIITSAKQGTLILFLLICDGR